MKKFIIGLYLLSFFIITGTAYAITSSPLSLFGNAVLGTLAIPVSDNGLDNDGEPIEFAIDRISDALAHGYRTKMKAWK